MGELFASERELVDSLVTHLLELADESACLIHAREVPNATRVVDLVALLGPDDPQALLATWHEPLRRLGSLDRAHLSLLALIWSERRIALARLARLTWTSPEALRECYLRRLEAMGLVECSSRGTYTPTGWACWRPGRIVAVEAKLMDWRGCLAQTVENATWADMSYAAFPSGGPLDRQDARAAFRSRGIGAVSVTETGIELVLKPRVVAGTSRRRRAEFALGVLRDLLRGSRWSACG